MGQAELVSEIDRETAVTQYDIDQLYEIYRYGRRLSLQLSLLPDSLATEINTASVETALSTLVEQSADILPSVQPGSYIDSDDSEGDTYTGVKICDRTVFGNVHEIRFKYLALHRFIDQNEEPAQVWETRYGFAWLCPEELYIAVLSKDDSVAANVLITLASALKVIPRSVRFPKELIDRHFSIDNARSLSHLDLNTGIHQSISGNESALSRYGGEIARRERLYLRLGARYIEEIEDGILSCIGLTASKGKIYFAKTLSTTQVRNWVQSRFKEFVIDLHETLKDAPEEVFRGSPVLAKRRNLSAIQQVHLQNIGDAVVAAKRNSLQTVNLKTNAHELYRVLGRRWLGQRLSCECKVCDEVCDTCPECSSTNIELTDHLLRCRNCEHTLSDGDTIELMCANGHRNKYLLAQSIGYVPTGDLLGILDAMLRTINSSFDRDHEALYLKSDHLFYFIVPPDTTVYNVYGDQIIANIRGSKNVAVGKDINFTGMEIDNE